MFTLFAIYVPSFIWSYFQEPKIEVVSDALDVVVQEVRENGDDRATADDDGEHASPNGRVVSAKVAVQETIVVRKKPLGVLETLLTGTPSPRSLLLSSLTFLINLAFTGMVFDRIYSEHKVTADDLSFARVGYVSQSEAKLLIREPDQSKMPVTVDVRIKDPQPPFDNPLWQTAGGVKWTLNETDYTAVFTIPLRHSKRRTYEWTTSNGHSGEFTSAPTPGEATGVPGEPFTFLATSCVISRLPYDPRDHPLAIPGMRHLANLLPSLHAQFMLFLGDFIYIDVPKWWGKRVEDYRQKYRQVYASPDWPAVGQNLSWIHVLDDHEIANDWSSNQTGVYHNAVEPWRHYHTAVNPPPARKAGTLVARRGATYYEFAQGPASFFMLDTRSYRSNNRIPFNSSAKTMLGAEQLDDFLAFLRRPEPRGIKWKIVASSVPFTKNWPVNKGDTWGGFLRERSRVLEAMWDVAARGVGVVILSGDRHEFAATKFPPPPGSKWPDSATVYEFSASPLSQFYSPWGTYKQTDDSDVAIKSVSGPAGTSCERMLTHPRYINTGNSKFGAITIETLAAGEVSSLKYRLFVDGVEAWNTVILSPEEAEGDRAGATSFWDKVRGH